MMLASVEGLARRLADDLGLDWAKDTDQLRTIEEGLTHWEKVVREDEIFHSLDYCDCIGGCCQDHFD